MLPDMKTLNYWIEAMRLRTLPVSLAGVAMAVAFSFIHHNFKLLPAVICGLFAVTAQVASNFANEYFDYTAGRDRAGREGPRRGVTEGEITPRAMKKAIYLSMFIAGCLGLSLVAWGGWWIIAVGVAIAVGLLAYSAGPFPMSTIGLGEVGVVVFFGLVPVNLTYYLLSGHWSGDVALASLAVGLMGANVLVVNNYRDIFDDKKVDKRTLCVRFGRPAMIKLYISDAVVAVVCLLPLFKSLGPASYIIGAVYLAASLAISSRMRTLEGAALTPLLGMTAMLMFAVALTACIWGAL